MISDGWLSSDYFAYTKECPITRETIRQILNSNIGTNAYECHERKTTNKLANSEKLVYHNKAGVAFGQSLDMYAEEAHSALTKQISPKFLKSGSLKYLIGILCGFCDGDGCFYYSRASSGKARFGFDIATSSKYLINSICQLLYQLGIRYSITTYPPRGWSKEAYTIRANMYDLWNYINDLQFVNPKNQATLEFWKSTGNGVESKDLIPVTDKEAKYLATLPRQDLALDTFVCPSGSHNVPRTRLMQYLPFIPIGSPLWNRITNTDIVWLPITSISEVEECQCWDFAVPTTKIYSINEGVIIYDTISVNSIMSEEANQETEKYYNSLGALVDLNGSLLINLDTDLTKWITFNLTRDPSMA